ncbi:hypothetical protein [Halapricum desulfuricans]|uniref:Zn ribbon containing protein n=1 Tax=Halapricum desulfuricans TaxID=2841257 RepID=A0A897NBC7_9EURY|nr:hypothetical protein [Halapricum desulfuricans]QSG09734.1 Zn ribbon containing protein [Halapricum desulfuricans]
MKWRCPQCGKPHERNDPPCDNCGHHRFERAVVPQATAEDDREQFVWACADCGRHHQRNNPPCSRCGGTTFEKKPLAYDDFETGDTPGYFELAGRVEAAAALVVVALVAVGALGFLGVIDIPGLTPQGPPSVEAVPGNETAVGDLSMAEVETSVFAELNVDRTPRLERSGDLDSMATYVNQRLVKNAYTDDDREITRNQLRRFDVRCSGTISVEQEWTMTAVADGTDAETTARRLLEQLGPTPDSVERVGIDAHAGPDDRVFVTVAYCQAADS